MASRQPKNFSIGNQLSTSAETLFTPDSTGVKGIIRVLSFYNSNSTTTRTVTVYTVEASGTAGTTNTLMQKAIPPLKTWNCIEAQGVVIEYNQSLQAAQDTGTDVNANGSCTLAI